MSKTSFGPIIIGKESGNTKGYSAIIVENGPSLVENQEYTPLFNRLIEECPDLLRAAFYNQNKTEYKLIVDGENKMSTINRIKSIILEEVEGKE